MGTIYQIDLKFSGVVDLNGFCVLSIGFFHMMNVLEVMVENTCWFHRANFS